MEDMGFPRDQCEAALRAAFGHTERAIEYLLNGIPDQPEQPPAAMPQPGAGVGAGAGLGAGAAAGAAPGGGNAPDFSAIANNPMFNQLRERIIQDPSFF